jgi:hypothetical protein
MYAWNQLGRKVIKGQKGIHTPDHDVGANVPICVDPLLEMKRQSGPGCPPEKVDSVDQNGRLVQADVRKRERLAHAIGLGYGIGIHQPDIQATVTPCAYRLIEVRQAHHYCASGAACTNHQHPDATIVEQSRRYGMFQSHLVLPPLEKLLQGFRQLDQ